MFNLDYETLRGVVRSGPAPLFATVSGAHLYGFPSPDSDVDLRGAFVLPLREVLGLRQSVETLTISRDEGIQVDWVAHDVRKFVHLMTGRNGYVLEQVFSPLVVLGGPWLDELRELGRGCITRNLYHHYRGFAHNQRQALAKEGATVKDLLYAYRVLFTGIHVLRSGQVEANLLAHAPRSTPMRITTSPTRTGVACPSRWEAGGRSWPRKLHADTSASAASAPRTFSAWRRGSRDGSSPEHSRRRGQASFRLDHAAFPQHHGGNGRPPNHPGASNLRHLPLLYRFVDDTIM